MAEFFGALLFTVALLLALSMLMPAFLWWFEVATEWVEIQRKKRAARR
ncbi:hypothetical protein ACFWY5_29685 [Nonomuraea sp. NPDC059007]